MKTTKIIMLALILIAIILAIVVYPRFPDKVASHWNAKGDVDGYMPRFWATAMLPLILIGCFLLFLILPKIDPFKRNIKKFEKYYDLIIIFVMLFLLYIYILTIVYNFGVKFNMNYAMLPALAILFFFIGAILPKCKRNWFLGIRTPWTLSSDKVWEKTHKLGAVLFKALAVIILISMFFAEQAMLLFICSLILIILIIFVYSYLEYKKEK